MKSVRADDGNDEAFGYGDFLSPFTWRYGSQEMRALFSEKRKRVTWRRVWLALAESEANHRLLTKDELADIRTFAAEKYVDIAKAHELERTIRHDLMAELRVFASQAEKGGGKLHLGATSMDIEDNADVIVLAKACDFVLSKLVTCLSALKEQILKHKETVCMAWTHLQPAEPSTLGYRLAVYAQDLVLDVQFLEFVRSSLLRGKGIKGAVGTSASFLALLGNVDKVAEMERGVMKSLEIEAFDVATQTYPRKVDFLVLSALASIAQSCHKFGLDLRVLQSPAFGELSEPIGEKQVGSSAMPFKRNPVSSERMCSLARFASALPSVAFMNAATSILERTLDDSAARRIIIPEAFLAVDECLATYAELIGGLIVHPAMMKRNLDKFGPFAGTEAVMMKLVQKGGDRQKIHEDFRQKSFRAWEEVMNGHPNPLERELSSDKAIAKVLNRKEIHRLLDPTNHVGDAPARCVWFVENRINPAIRRHRPANNVLGRSRF